MSDRVKKEVSVCLHRPEIVHQGRAEPVERVASVPMRLSCLMGFRALLDSRQLDLCRFGPECRRRPEDEAPLRFRVTHWAYPAGRSCDAISLASLAGRSAYARNRRRFKETDGHVDAAGDRSSRD